MPTVNGFTMEVSADTRARLDHCRLYLSHLNKGRTTEAVLNLALRRFEKWAVRELLRARQCGRISMTPDEIRALVPAKAGPAAPFTGPPSKVSPVVEYEP